MNIKFNYLYRDASNYKQFGFQIFSNPDNLSLPEIETRIRATLIDGEFFDPVKWGVPRLHFDGWDPEVDHEWNEFEGVEETEETPTNEKSISLLLAKARHLADQTYP
jgi:hypothetical protein